MPTVAVPVGVGVAGAVGSGVAAGISAAVRWGPLLLQLAERGSQPIEFRRTPVNSPGRSRQLEQLRVLLDGARVAVGLPQPPPIPGGPGFGAVGSLLNAALLLRALVAAGELAAQVWGGHNSRTARIQPDTGTELVNPPDFFQEFKDPDSDLWLPLDTWEGLVVYGPGTIPSGEVDFGGGLTIQARPGLAIGGSLAEILVRRIDGSDGVKVKDIEGAVYNQPPVVEGFPFAFRWQFRSVERPDLGVVEWQYEMGPLPVRLPPGPVLPGGDPQFPVDLSEISTTGAAPIPGLWGGAGSGVGPEIPPLADPGPLLQPQPLPGALPVPSNPAPGQVGGTDPAAGTGAAGNVAPGGLVGPVPTVRPLPAFVPRPVPGPTLPEFLPEPQPETQPGTTPTTPTRPTIPGTRPGTTPATPGPPFPDVPVEPGQVPGPGTTPAPGPAPGPGPSPGPGPAPGPGPSPGPAPGPGPNPGPTPGPGGVPQPGPGAVPTTNPGLVPLPIPAPTPTTPADQHFPVPGGAPVTGNGPRATLQGLAQELGRQEQKLARLMNDGRGPDGGPIDWGDLLDKLRQLVALLLTVDGAGAYTISSPCNIDGTTGEPAEPLTAEWGATIGEIPALRKRLDALAELLQHHKDLPQPICARPRPTGDPVTVTFEQVPNELAPTA